MSAVVAPPGSTDYTFLWWDIRPHPKLGTLEVRAMDAQARLGSVCGLAALVHGLVIAAAEAGEDAAGAPARGARRVVVPRRPRRARRDRLARRGAAADPRARGRRDRARPAPRASRRRGGRARGGRADPARRQRRAAHARGPCRGRDGARPRAARRRVGRAPGGPNDVVRPAQRPAPARRRRRPRRRGARSRSPSRRCSTCAPPRTPCWSAATSASTATPPSTRWPASCSRRCRCRCTSWPATTTTHEALSEAFGTPARYTAEVGELALVACDTPLPGRMEGELDLDWLEAQLEAARGRPVVVAMHHPPLLTGIPVLDEIGLPAQRARRRSATCSRASRTSAASSPATSTAPRSPCSAAAAS